MKPLPITVLCRAIRCMCLLGMSAASIAPALAQNPSTDPSTAKTKAKDLQAVRVTAGKRNESVRDIAGSVNVVTAAQLDAMGAQSLADYIQRTPGVVFNNYQPGVSHVVIRGIATSAGNVQGQDTTGFYLNDVPLTEPGWTIVVPDIDTFDLNRVEVLRGPQGTMFGSASMGGAINYIANVADPSAFDAAAEATVSQTRNANVGFTGKAMVNLPLKTDVLAVRAVAEYRDAPGYLDNIGTGKNGANTTKVKGGRFSAVLTPNDTTKLTWLSLLQNTDADDNAYQIQDLGDLTRSTAIPEFTNTKVAVHSLRWDQDLGWGTFTALAAYQTKQQKWQFDYTPYRSAYNSDLGLDLTNPLYINDGGKSRGRSIELRLASAKSGRFEWLLGASYVGVDKHLYEQLGDEGAAAAFDASSSYGPGSGAAIAPDGDIFNAYYDSISASEAALFGEGSLWLNPKWKLTVGGRLFHTRESVTSTQVGFSSYPGSPIVSISRNSDSDFNPKISLTYEASDTMMFYGLISQGYRFGTPNTAGLSAYAVPSGSKSDSLVNYELGTRTSWADGHFVVDATAFYVDWKDIQLRLQTPDYYAYSANGGKAYSRGIELSAQWRPTNQFEWDSTVTWQHARLDQDLYILYYGTAPKGSQLPGSADWSINTTLRYHFDAPYDPTVSLSHQFLSNGISDLNSAVPGVTPDKQGNYNLFDLRYAMTFGNSELSLWVSNVTDKRGITRSVAEANGIGEGIVLPRTIGVTARWHY